jgi:thiamine-monophosphate kinase
MTGEFELIRRYFAPLARGFPGAFGLRDDAAVIAPAPGHELVVKTDAVVGGVHFFENDPPDRVARKALRVNLSDLAAKGAVPRAYLLDLMLPRDIGEPWIAAFAGGLAVDQAAYGITLVGGDTDSTPGAIAIAITALGEVPVGGMVRRDGARAGDAVFVTGTLGDAALALHSLLGGLRGIDADCAAHLVDRYQLPRPRVALGFRWAGIATAAIDVSDGLVADLGHLCDASRLSAIIEAARVPLSAAARAALAAEPGLRDAVFGGGDDYEVLFTAPPEAADALARLSRELDIPIAAIGRMQAPGAAGPSVTVNDEHGRPLAFDRAGWAHFAA